MEVQTKMVNKNAQEWLNNKYPFNGTFQRKADQENKNKSRAEITELDISKGNLEKHFYGVGDSTRDLNKILAGSLKLEGFINLKKLICSGHELISLDVSDCPNLEELDCQNNQLVSLNVNGCCNLKKINCFNNDLSKLDLSSCSKLKGVNINNNPTLMNNKIKELENKRREAERRAILAEERETIYQTENKELIQQIQELQKKNQQLVKEKKQDKSLEEITQKELENSRNDEQKLKEENKELKLNRYRTRRKLSDLGWEAKNLAKSTAEKQEKNEQLQARIKELGQENKQLKNELKHKEREQRESSQLILVKDQEINYLKSNISSQRELIEKLRDSIQEVVIVEVVKEVEKIIVMNQDNQESGKLLFDLFNKNEINSLKAELSLAEASNNAYLNEKVENMELVVARPNSFQEPKEEPRIIRMINLSGWDICKEILSRSFENSVKHWGIKRTVVLPHWFYVPEVSREVFNYAFNKEVRESYQCKIQVLPKNSNY